MWPNGNTKSNDHCIMGDTKLSAKMKDICISASYFFGCDWFIRDHSYYTSALYSSATWPWQTQNCHKYIARLLHDDATSSRLKLCTESWKANPRKKKEKIHGRVDPSIRSIKTCDNDLTMEHRTLEKVMTKHDEAFKLSTCKNQSQIMVNCC